MEPPLPELVAPPLLLPPTAPLALLVPPKLGLAPPFAICPDMPPLPVWPDVPPLFAPPFAVWPDTPPIPVLPPPLPPRPPLPLAPPKDADATSSREASACATDPSMVPDAGLMVTSEIPKRGRSKLKLTEPALTATV